MNKKKLWMVAGSFCVLSTLTTSYFFSTKSKPKGSVDEALLSLIKNDLRAFESYINSGGSLHAELPAFDGLSMTVAQGVAYFERLEFIKYLQDKKTSFLLQNEGSDMLTIAVKKNNKELLSLLLLEKPNLNFRYGHKKMTLLHLASSQCSSKIVDTLMQTGSFKLEEDTKLGFNALTLAAENECLPLLSYWKGKGVNFGKRDKRGISALRILYDKDDPVMKTFAQSFQVRLPATVAAVSKPTSFYRKRVNPKEMPVDYSALIEPEGRPEEAIETAEKSEFAD